MKQLHLKELAHTYLQRSLHRQSGRAKKTSLTRIYSVSALSLIAAIGVSTGLSGSDSAAANQSSRPETNGTQTQIELRKEQRATSDDVTERHNFRQSPGNSATSNTQTTVTVNGETMSVPENGTMNRSMTTDDGNTHIDVSVRNESSGTDNDDASDRRSSQRMRLNVRSDIDSNSSTSTNINKKE